MKILIVYSSRTGNTRMVAEAISEVMGQDALMTPVEKAPDPNSFDLIIVGFWVDKGLPDNAARKYMTRISGKKVGVFGTLGAYPDSQHAQDCMTSAREFLAANEVLVTFMCQGKVDPKIIKAMSKVHPMTPERQARLSEAAKHPDSRDLNNARAAFSNILKNQEQP